jgi:hypothetical protein
MTGLLAKPSRCGQKHITLLDTFVADGRDGDLLFCFLSRCGPNLSNSWCANKASRFRALSAHGSFPDQAAL